MQYKLSADFFGYLGINGVKIDDLQKKAKISYRTWMLATNGQTISKTTKERILLGATVLDLNPKIMDKLFVEIIPEHKKLKIELEKKTRSRLIYAVVTGRCKYIDLARYLGVTKQLVYSFKQGAAFSLDNLKRTRFFLDELNKIGGVNIVVED